ncbi:hypothetical protein HOS87_gp07 [Pseudomonas phage phiNV3]|uniref:Uncharacterized protein n=1 Tax=Pseudomonas phage phiNV3 TaxID=2079544 RepID=A0A2P0ZLI2_9CAUD|nr:hypothetical protein [Pseudomonas tolaasii]YP_009798987.1 hypothetical protein HOS87_gp07 [Pseudomonas phage phiNV3]ARB30326.1 hypothetical protein B5P22_24570 [Pseudomonas tolaasii]AVH86117.1 hypothetical protein phiNV3_p07 [Pseudomonas phage phiNV3]
MRNKPSKLYILLNAAGEPYRVGGKVEAYNSKGRAIKQAKALYESRALLFSVVRAGLVLEVVE